MLARRFAMDRFLVRGGTSDEGTAYGLDGSGKEGGIARKVAGSVRWPSLQAADKCRIFTSWSACWAEMDVIEAARAT